MPYNWLPPVDTDCRRLRSLLRNILIHLEGGVEQFERATEDLRSISGDGRSIGIGRYAERAEMCDVQASSVEDEYCTLDKGGR